ncbi:MAG: hypothetical protein MUE69_29110 [Myxococcota bacterium]|nr:hypothetical protein [Myxococcota bacterium]
MADDKYKVDFEIDTTKAVKGLGDVERAASKTAQTFERSLTPATTKAADATAKTHAQFERALAGTTAFTGALATLGPQLGPVGAGLNAAAQGAGALSAAMGPAGVVIGGVVGLLPALITGIVEAASATDQAASSQARWTREIVEGRERLAALAGTIAQARARADEFRNVLRRGVFDAADAADIETQIAAAQIRTSTLREQATRAQLRGNVSEALRAEGDIVELEGRLTVLNLALDEARAKEEARASAGKFAGGGSNRGGSPRDRTAELEKEKNAAIRLAQEEAAIAQQLVDKEWERLEAVKQIAEQEARTLAAIEESLALKNKLAQDERDQREYAQEIERAEGEKNKAMIQFQEQQASEQERYNKVVQRSQAGMEGVLDIAIRTAQLQKETNASFGEAFKTAVDEWLRGFALQSAYKGVAATAEAIGSAVTNQPNAAAKFAEAGIHFALAAAAGGASAAIPNAGGGGGGGGRAARPEAVGGGGGGGGGGTIVVNFNGPVSEAEMGRMQQRAARAADRRYGSRR